MISRWYLVEENLHLGFERMSKAVISISSGVFIYV